MSYHISREEEAKQDTIKCYILAVVITLGMFAALVYGFAWLSSTEKINAEFYGAKHLENRIKVLEGQIQRIENHKHQFWTGKIK